MLGIEFGIAASPVPATGSIEVCGAARMVTNVKNLPIQFDRDRVEAFCRDRGIVIAHVWARQEVCNLPLQAEGHTDAFLNR